MEASIEVRTLPYGTAEYLAATELRDVILRRPLGLHLSAAELEKERGDIHVGAFRDGQLRGCLVLTPVSARTLRMRQVAVDPKYQGQGIGHQLVAYSEGYAREQGYEEIMLHARRSAAPFYLKQSYVIVGDEFEEVTLPHLVMVKMIKPLADLSTGNERKDTHV